MEQDESWDANQIKYLGKSTFISFIILYYI